MGIVLVLIFYAVALTLFAAIGAAVFAFLTARLIGKSTPRRGLAIAIAALFPFGCVLFAGLWFTAYATVNTLVLHRDPGLGDSWETPLPNGYALVMIDVTDQGTVYNPRTQSGDGSVGTAPDAVFGVRQLQVSGQHIFGAADSGYFGRLGQQSTFVDDYFELDTTRNEVHTYPTLEALTKQAMSEGVTLKLRPFASVFADYRTTWFDDTADVLLVLAPSAAFALLIRWILKIRRSRQAV